MPIFNFLLPRHRRYARLADAFVDGELGGGDLASFEAHLPGCEPCRAAVAEARTLKASVSALPEFAAPRSFSLTPAMVALPVASKPQKSGTPLYLGFARAGAALSIGAFATVLAVSALDSDGQQSADSDKLAGEFHETMMSGAAKDDDGANREGSGNGAPSGAPEAAPTAAPAPQLVPATAGGASGAGVPTPAVPSPMPPQTGVDTAVTPFADTSRSSEYSTEPPAGGGAVIEPVPGGVASSEELFSDKARGSNDDGFGSWTVALGALAAASIGVLGFLELSRRRAS